MPNELTNVNKSNLTLNCLKSDPKAKQSTSTLEKASQLLKVK